MPKNKNALTRYKILDELLSNRYHNYSLDDLTEEVCNRLSEIEPDTDGVSRRTIEKDIEYLEYKGPFTGVDIERYYIGNEKTGVKRCVCATQILTSRYSASLSLPPRNICSRKLYRCWDNLTDCQTLTDLKVLGLDLELNITTDK